MDWLPDYYDPNLLRAIESLEEEVRQKPAFDSFRKRFVDQLKNDSGRLAAFSAEDLINQVDSFEELISLREYLQSRYGGDNVWWNEYHRRRIELAMLPSNFGELEGRTRFAIPVSAQRVKRSNVAGLRGVGVRRNLAGQLFTARQLSGVEPVEISTKGVSFPSFLKGKPKANSWFAFDIETTGLLKQLAHKDTGSARGVASVGYSFRGIKGGGYGGVALANIAKNRPYFGEFIEEEILPRHQQLETEGFRAKFLKDPRFGRTKYARGLSERNVVKGFIKGLESHKGAALLGYNIEQFDIPYMKMMAKRHGMDTRLSAALASRKVIDVGDYAKAFLSEQLGGKFVGWQEGMFTQLRMNPIGWKQQSLAYALGFDKAFGLKRSEGALSAAAHTPFFDVKMTEYIYETLTADPTGEGARKIWRAGGEKRYMEALGELGQELVPLSELEKMTKVRGGKRYFDLPGYMHPKAARGVSLADRILGVKGVPEIAPTPTSSVREVFRLAPDRPGFSRAPGLLRGIAKTGAKGALLGAILPGEGVSNLLGGVAAAGAWDVARKRGAGIGLATVSAGVAYAASKGIGALFSGQSDEVARKEAARKYKGEIAASNQANLDYYLPDLAATTAPLQDKSVVPKGKNLLIADKLLRTAASDNKYSQEELGRLAYLANYGAAKNALIQTLSNEAARQQLTQTVNWRNKKHAEQIQAYHMESPGFGSFGFYSPGSKVLGVHSIFHPSLIGAVLGRAYEEDFDNKKDKALAEAVSWMTNPIQFEETTLHEGLHAVWDVDIDPAHKQAFISEAERQLAEGGPDVEMLAEKAPIYAKMVNRAKPGLFWQDKGAVEWVANEMWAHRGILQAYEDTGYSLPRNAELDAITAQYVNWSRRKRDPSPDFTGSNVEAALAAGGLTPEIAKAHLLAAQRRARSGSRVGVQFSGRDDTYNTIEGLRHGGLAADARRSLTEFGSGFDPLRKIAAKAFGKLDVRGAYDKMRRSSSFRKSLESGTFVKELGAGQYGKTALYETTLPSGDILKYVKKTEHSLEDLGPVARKQVDKGLSDWGTGFKNEYKGMAFLEEGKLVPSPYLRTDNALYMEYMPGGTLKSQGKALGPGHLREILGDIEKAKEAGFYNPDVHAGNILFDPKTNRMSWLDFGSATFDERKAQLGRIYSAKKAIEHSEVGKTIESLRGSGVTGEDLAEIVNRAGWKGVPKGLKLGTEQPEPTGFLEKIKGFFTRRKINNAYNQLTSNSAIDPIPGKDDSYNTIEGLRHGGFAEDVRKSITEFGSGYTAMFATALIGSAAGILALAGRYSQNIITSLTGETTGQRARRKKREKEEQKKKSWWRTAVRTKVNRRFGWSGSDDNYNTIPGLRDQGFAQDIRHSLTEFGSGYQGGLKVFGQEIDPEIQQFRERWFSTPEARQGLRRRMEELAPDPPGDFEEDEMTELAGGRMAVNLSQFDWKFDDPDTIILDRKGFFNIFDDDVVVRLAGIDAPEIEHPDDPTNWFRFHRDQPYGQEATDISKELWGDREDLRLVIKPNQRTYGRYIGLLEDPESEDPINLQMVERGLAAALPWGEAGSDIYPREEFIAAEKEAMAAERGMWSEDYYHRYVDISEAVGRRITFNSFTDLSRLSQNYGLAAAERLMSREDIDYEPWMGKYIGSKLRKQYGPKESRRSDTLARTSHHVCQAPFQAAHNGGRRHSQSAASRGF